MSKNVSMMDNILNLAKLIGNSYLPIKEPLSYCIIK